MKLLLISAVLLVAFAAAKRDYSGYQVLRVSANNNQQFRALKKLEDKYEGMKETQFWNHVTDVSVPISIQVSPDAVQTVMEQLVRHGIQVEVVIEDLQKLISEQEKKIAERKATDASYQVDKYHDYDEIVQYLSDLSSQNAGTEYKSIGKTIEGRDIYMFSIGSGDKPAVSLECNIHAREWIAGATCINLITNLLTNNADKDLKDAYDWYFIPIANPDGYVYTWDEDRMWRKNRRPGSLCDGVDLNRNFDADFGSAGASDFECAETYHGKEAFSEPETQAERDALSGLKGRLVAHWSFHSYGLWYLLPYCSKYQGPSDFDNMLRVAQVSGEAIKNTHGMDFTIGECAKTLYVASGGTHDWVYDALSPKFSSTLELRDQGRHGFILPEDQIMPVFEEVWNGIKAALKEIQ